MADNPAELVRASGLGPCPGGDVLDLQRECLDVLAAGPLSRFGLPFLVHPAGMGPYTSLLGRTCAVLAELVTEVGHHGWKLADRPGIDAARLAAQARAEADALAVAGLGYTGPLTVSLLGPLSLAALLYTARGDIVLADRGAILDVAASLAEGTGEYLATIRTAVPGVDRITVQFDESLLGAALAGVLPTFSGAARIRPVTRQLADEALRMVMAATVPAPGVTPPVGTATAEEAARRPDAVVHVGTSVMACEAAFGAGAPAVGVTLGPWNEPLWTAIAQAVERGDAIWFQVPPAAVSQCAGPDVSGAARRLTEPWRRIGLPMDALGGAVLVTALDHGHEVQTGSDIDTLLRVAEVLSEQSR